MPYYSKRQFNLSGFEKAKAVRKNDLNRRLQHNISIRNKKGQKWLTIQTVGFINW